MQQRPRRLAPEVGTSVIEVIVALFVVALVMTGAGTFFFNSLKNSGLQSQRSTAVALTNQALEKVQAVKPDQLLIGRSQDVVRALQNPLVADADVQAVTTQDVVTSTIPETLNYQPPPVAAAEVVKTDRLQTVDGTSYRLRIFVNVCYQAGTIGTTCTRTSSAGSSPIFRATVLTTWTPAGGVTCPGGCRFSASQLVDFQGDPKFNLNISLPTITGVTPGAVAANQTRALTVTGTNFVAGATVIIQGGGGSFGSVVTNTGTSITVPWTAGSTPGSYTLSVVNPDGGRADYTVTVTPNPTITSLMPSSIQNGAGNTGVIIAGTGFQAGVVVSMTGGSGAGSYINGSAISASFAADGSIIGPAAVTVTNPDGGSATATLTILASTPTITGGMQTGAVTYAGQPTQVTLTGTGFMTGATVTVPAGSGTVNSTTFTGATTATISFTPTVNGQVTFTLTNPDGGSASRPVSVSTLAPRPLPTLSTISPARPTKGSLVNFIVTGTGFDPAAVITVSWTGDGLTTPGQALYRSPTEVGFTGTTNSGNNKSAIITVTVTNPGQTAVSQVFTVTTN